MGSNLYQNHLFETVDRIDRKYSAGGRLEQSKDWTYKYDDEGRLIEKRHRIQVQQAWKYHWNSAGMLEEVVRPDGSTVSFKYDALGRRIEKRLFNRKTRWVWDGNVPLHEWYEVYTKDFTEEKGEFYTMKPSKTTTWLFEEGTFVPNGKLIDNESFSIQSNYLGTPEVMYDADGKVVWSAELDAYGDVRNLTGERMDCPFRYQGQYEDKETGLYYNRFRFYSKEEGMYISQDPIQLEGGIQLFGYVCNPNIFFDVWGLAMHHTIPRRMYNPRKNKKKDGTVNRPTPIVSKEVAKDKDVRGTKSNPNMWNIPDDVHQAIHNPNSEISKKNGGDYNAVFEHRIRELEKTQGSVSAKDVVGIRDQMVKDYDLEQFNPKKIKC